MRNTLMSLMTYLVLTPLIPYTNVSATIDEKTEKNNNIKSTISEIIPTGVNLPNPEIETSKINTSRRGYYDFLYKLGEYESGNDYKKVNTLGYLGKYQFGKSTLKTIKIKATKEEFLNNPQLQETAMWRLLKHNRHRLRKYIEWWDGKLLNGRVITESGILAAAHLAGEGNVKKFFKTGLDSKDAYGTRLTKYLYMFSGYDLQLK